MHVCEPADEQICGGRDDQRDGAAEVEEALLPVAEPPAADQDGDGVRQDHRERMPREALPALPGAAAIPAIPGIPGAVIVFGQNQPSSMCSAS